MAPFHLGFDRKVSPHSFSTCVLLNPLEGLSLFVRPHLHISLGCMFTGVGLNCKA